MIVIPHPREHQYRNANNSLVLNEPYLQKQPGLTEVLGETESEIVQQITYWRNHPYEDKLLDQEIKIKRFMGRIWVRIPPELIFNKWSGKLRHIKRDNYKKKLGSSRAQGVLWTADLNATAGDNVNWYTIIEEVLNPLTGIYQDIYNSVLEERWAIKTTGGDWDFSRDQYWTEIWERRRDEQIRELTEGGWIPGRHITKEEAQKTSRQETALALSKNTVTPPEIVPEVTPEGASELTTEEDEKPSEGGRGKIYPTPGINPAIEDGVGEILPHPREDLPQVGEILPHPREDLPQVGENLPDMGDKMPPPSGVNFTPSSTKSCTDSRETITRTTTDPAAPEKADIVVEVSHDPLKATLSDPTTLNPPQYSSETSTPPELARPDDAPPLPQAAAAALVATLPSLITTALAPEPLGAVGQDFVNRLIEMEPTVITLEIAARLVATRPDLQEAMNWTPQDICKRLQAYSISPKSKMGRTIREVALDEARWQLIFFRHWPESNKEHCERMTAARRRSNPDASALTPSGALITRITQGQAPHATWRDEVVNQVKNESAAARRQAQDAIAQAQATAEAAVKAQENALAELHNTVCDQLLAEMQTDEPEEYAAWVLDAEDSALKAKPQVYEGARENFRESVQRSFERDTREHLRTIAEVERGPEIDDQVQRRLTEQEAAKAAQEKAA